MVDQFSVLIIISQYLFLSHWSCLSGNDIYWQSMYR